MGVVLVSVKLEFKMEMMSVIFQLHSFSRSYCPRLDAFIEIRPTGL